MYMYLHCRLVHSCSLALGLAEYCDKPAHGGISFMALNGPHLPCDLQMTLSLSVNTSGMDKVFVAVPVVQLSGPRSGPI